MTAQKQTGFGIDDKDLAKGIDTLEKKLESLCPDFERLDRAFGFRLNIRPPVQQEPANQPEGDDESIHSEDEEEEGSEDGEEEGGGVIEGQEPDEEAGEDERDEDGHSAASNEAR